jgi:hypothetical protein
MGQKLFKGLQEIGICYCLILGILLIPYTLASVGHYILNLNLVMSFTFWAWVMMLPTACVLAMREAGNIMHGGGEAFLTALLFLSAGAGLSAYLIVLLFPKSVEELTLEMQGIFLIGFPFPYSVYRFLQSLAVSR